MAETRPAPAIAIFGRDQVADGESRGCYLWPPGYAAAVTAAGGNPVQPEPLQPGQTWDELLNAVQGILFLGNDGGKSTFEEERLVRACERQRIPFLGVDAGMHLINQAFGGNIHTDLPKELPQALQHRHPPEKGLRHAIMVEPNTRISTMYGEGEIVVNSEHRCAINQLCKGFLVTARALDGVIEAIEYETERWFCIGVQWHPASASASGLDIQLFRGLVEAAQERFAEATSDVSAAA
ncbi:MAG: gamma-glutamyl-gamma-aminobutyrate hydrolase family protein [Gemmataceae bacterium]